MNLDTCRQVSFGYNARVTSPRVGSAWEKEDMNHPRQCKREPGSRPTRPWVLPLALVLSLCLGAPPALTGQALPAKDLDETPGGTPGKKTAKTEKNAASITVRSISSASTLPLEENPPGFVAGKDDPGILQVGPEQHRLENLLFLDFTAAKEKTSAKTTTEKAEVVLANGDHFWATPIAIEPVKDDDFLVVTSQSISQPASKDALRFSLAGLRLLLYRNAFTSERQWSRFRSGLLKSRPKNDVAHLSAGTRLTGFLEGLKEGDISFSANGVGQVKLSSAKVRALDLAKIEEDAPAVDTGKINRRLVAAFLGDGGKLRGDLKSLGKEGLAMEHEFLGSIRVPLSEIRQISFLGGRCQYLSDLKPVKTREHLGSLFLARLPYKNDRNVLGNPLRMKGKTYPKGLGVHAYSKLDYDLAGGFQKFQVTIGLDDSARPLSGQDRRKSTGSVIFRIFLDGKLVEEKAMAFNAPPVELDLAVSDARLLSLEVDFGGKDASPALDRANWCGARIIK